MRIKMLETRKGTEDGFTLRQYVAGREYEVKEGLAFNFFAMGYAEPVTHAEQEGNHHA